MAIRETASHNGRASRRAWFVAACLAVLFVAALFLRAYWNLEAANPAEGEYILSGGSDPYYHKRAADAIQDGDFRHHLNDPLLNYPRGSENPNPPFYQWFIAAGGQMMAGFFGGDVATSTWEAAIWSPAIFGALTIFPIYFIGAALFDRRVGLIAALLWTVSTSAIDAGGVGLADHDATVIFFASLAFLFYIQTIRHFRGDGNWIARWNDGSSVTTGFRNLFAQRRAGFAYALLTAISIAAVALTWKGFNYVLGILFLYAIAQMVVDHWRSRDSTGLFLATALAMFVSVLIAYPYYAQAGVANFLQPTWYILAAFVVAGAVLIPTRDLPTILVFPIAIVIGILAALVAFFVVPTVAQSLLYATVYFKQTRLYETIAEAHPADFSTIAFGIGPVAFLLALAGWFILLFRVAARPVQATISTVAFLTLALLAYITLSQIGDGSFALPVVGAILLAWLLVMFSLGDTPVGRTHAFAILWAAIALFMAASAVRFLINAIPIFAVFGAFMAVWVLDWLDFGAIRKSLAANRGNTWQGLRKGTRPMHIVGVILIALLFVFPTTILAADAALPPEAEDKLARETDSDFARRFYTERMGAYGGGFGSVKPWIAPLQWLDQRDANITNPADRPAFLAWWDYGHWALSIGRHPTVADNFQNGYEFAANFILSQNEAHAIQLLAARTAEAPGADLEAALRTVGSADPAGDAARIARWEHVESLDITQSAQLLAEVEQQTGKKIRYFAVDIRMLPYDNPQTPNIDQSSIFYAPVRLKGEEPDNYVTTKVNLGVAVPGASDGYVTVERFRQLASDPVRQYSGTGERYDYQQTFFNSMYWRAYVGTQVEVDPTTPTLGNEVEAALGNPRPALGLEHFRLTYAGDIQRMYRGGDPTNPGSYLYYPGVMIIEYFPGAIIEGTVTEDGQPVAGATVTAFDDAGKILADAFQSTADPNQFHVPHASATTDASGNFRIVAPFAMPGGAVTLDAVRAGVSIGSTQVAVTREQAEARETISGVTITVARGSVEGIAFYDVDGNGQFNETAGDSPAAGVELTIGGVTVTTGDDGAYRADDVSAGLQNVTTSDPTLEVALATSRVRVQPGGDVTLNVALEPRAARINGTLVADLDGDATTDNEPVEFVALRFEPDATVEGNTAQSANVGTEAGGTFSALLRPGTYTVTGEYTHESGVYTLTQTLVVAPGESRDETFVMTRGEA
ncbi:MAG TPA: STT3 domain-containing protein [Candidatus Thermoplasmatota archaeon]|nr:STT3 domain-containing protein [Candidatus Thermoplasmatota archaeon]